MSSHISLHEDNDPSDFLQNQRLAPNLWFSQTAPRPQNIDAPALKDAIHHVDDTIRCLRATIEIWNGYQPSVDGMTHLESQLEIWYQYRRSLAARLYFLQPPPFVTLPVELLVEIFSWCISPYDRWTPVHEIPLHFRVPCRRRSSMYILAQVCQQWRDVICTNPALHPVLVLTNPPEKRNQAETIARLKTYLESTHQCPINFEIIYRKGPWRRKIFRQLWESPERWGKVEIIYDHHGPPIPIPLALHLLHFPHLSALHTRDFTLPAEPFSRDNLPTLEILGIDARPTVLSVVMPVMPNITCLHVFVLWRHPRDFYTLVGACPLLKALHLKGWAATDYDANPSFHEVEGPVEPVVLSRLRELHILFDADDPLSCIAAPNLVFLKDERLSSASINFVRRSECATTLTDLDLEVEDETMSANAVALMRLTTRVSYLRLSFPFLPRLVAHRSPVYGKIIEALSECTHPGRDNRRFDVLPKLRHLVVNGDQVYESYTCFAALIDLIYERSRA
ncbi:hypothetical protein FISHEDRAFT_76390 [Fistulina hepatica ATCC 64428]|uniref:F-box domain-containing protein n=1 Tax=Fistulina hepatica ATCC 64428 TaxID=1128425 RepID=A0A0D7A408_9AGAR|nr:hypothetical protein FISHEDRAFT_76390 [Fistulina hepatica ATCC 64428]